MIRTLLILASLCLFSVGLQGLRMYFTDSIHFLFLYWNLFLAAVPLGLALILYRFRGRPSLLVGGSLLAGWLLFFPNSCYVLTDFLHLKYRAPVPLWYDMLLLFSFGFSGLFLGFFSLHIVQQKVTAWYGRFWGWSIVLGSLFLSSFGIYLGRFLRWNSWDILTQYKALLWDVWHRVAHPWEHPRTWAVTVILSVLFVMIYALLRQFSTLSELRQRS